MEKLILFFLSCFITTANGQEEFNKWMIGVNLSSDYCYRTLKLNNDNYKFVLASWNENEQGKFGYTTGIVVNMNRNNHFGFEAGIQYSNKGYARKKMELTFSDPIDPRYGFVYDSTQSEALPSYLKINYNFYYVDIPLRVFYAFGEGKLRCITSLGITTSIFQKSTITFIKEFGDGSKEKETHEDDKEYKSINLSPTASIGLDYRLSDKFHIRAEPTFRYGILKIIDAPITGYLWNAGLNISCYYSLK